MIRSALRRAGVLCLVFALVVWSVPDPRAAWADLDMTQRAIALLQAGCNAPLPKGFEHGAIPGNVEAALAARPGAARVRLSSAKRGAVVATDHARALDAAGDAVSGAVAFAALPDVRSGASPVVVAARPSRSPSPTPSPTPKSSRKRAQKPPGQGQGAGGHAPRGRGAKQVAQPSSPRSTSAGTARPANSTTRAPAPAPGASSFAARPATEAPAARAARIATENARMLTGHVEPDANGELHTTQTAATDASPAAAASASSGAYASPSAGAASASSASSASPTVAAAPSVPPSAAVTAPAVAAAPRAKSAARSRRAASAPRAVAQVTTSPEPISSPSVQPSAAASAGPNVTPAPTPTPIVGAPAAPNGPQILVPRPLPTPSGPTAPPIPSPGPSVSSSAGPVILEQQTAPPQSGPPPTPPIVPGPVVSRSPVPSPAPSLEPDTQTLGPDEYAILGNEGTGTREKGKPWDLDGNVNVFYRDGVLGGDHAHYDGTRYIDLTGHTFVRNRGSDTVLYADSVRFDTQTQKATLINGRGQSSQGVEQGLLHFRGRQMQTDRTGTTHVDRANLTTCENERGGYHLESKTLDVYPGDKAVARSAVLFLGALAIFYLPIAVISLRHDEPGTRRNPGFIPILGYSAVEGFYIKARLGFSPSDYYYGYYRVEAYTRIGLGLGYVATLRKKNGRRITDINVFRLKNKQDGSEQNNLQFNDQEFFSRTTRAQLGLNYTGNYGPLVSLPPQYSLTAAADHGTERGNRQNYSFRRDSTGSESQQNNYAISDHRQFSTNFTNDLTVSLTNSSSFSFGPSITSQTLHFGTLTHFASKNYDYDFTLDRYDSTLRSSIQKEPELAIRPHNSLFPRLRAVPINAEFTLGVYQDPTADLQTSRGEGRFTIGPGLAHVLGSDFSGQVTVQQDAYGTGDLKAQIGQQATLTTPLFGHLVNTISYNESHVNGPLAEPFKSIDVLGNGLKQANDVLRIFNGDVYTLSLTATTFFNRQAQAVGYQLTSRPSPRSSLMLGGNFTPGPGNGFDRTNIQFATPFGYKSDLQFSSFIDWKQSGRLVSKNIYYRHIVGDCYEVRISYNEDLRQVTASINLLAFPSHAVNFGLGSTSLGSIIPQSFSSDQFR